VKFGLIGHPVSHSLSPVIHAAAYRELGVEHRYELFDAPSEADVERFVAALRRGEVSGLNVTIPWKRQAFALSDERVALAQRLGVANVLACQAGRVIAHNTDALALETEFRERASTRSAVVLGSGGATPAVVAACRSAGIDEVWVTARRFTPEQPESSWPGAAELLRLGARLMVWPEQSTLARRAFEARCGAAGLVVQCTSAGMQGADSGEPLAAMIPWHELPADALGYDLIYAPLETPFLRAARLAGRRTRHGLPMLVLQAALSIEIWLGRRPALDPLQHAALEALARRGRK